MKHDTISLAEVEERLNTREPVEDILSDSDYQTNWSNHWDVNPFIHGGCFVQWQGDCWKLILTEPYGEDKNGDPVSSISWINLYTSEIFERKVLYRLTQSDIERDPYIGLREDFRRATVSQYTRSPIACTYDLSGLKGLLFDFVCHYGMYHLGGVEGPERYNESDYWDILKELGVNVGEWR